MCYHGANIGVVSNSERLYFRRQFVRYHASCWSWCFDGVIQGSLLSELSEQGLDRNCVYTKFSNINLGSTW